MLLKFLVMLVEFTKLIGEDVSVWHKVKLRLSKPLLHPHNIKAKSIFTGDFMTLREMINLLILIEAFIQITLAAA